MWNLGACCLISKYLGSFQLSSCYWFLVWFYGGLRTYCMIFIFLHLLRYVLEPRMWPVLVTVPSEFENIQSAVTGWSLLEASMKLSCLKVPFRSTISLSIFCLFDLAITDGVGGKVSNYNSGFLILSFQFY